MTPPCHDDGTPMTPAEFHRRRYEAAREIVEEYGDVRQRRWRPKPRNSPTYRGDVLFEDPYHPVAALQHTLARPWPSDEGLQLFDGKQLVTILPRDTGRN